MHDRTLSHYKIFERIGAGGMGEVYLAEDLKLERRIALKVLPEPLATDPERLERFRREARAVARLNHPNIVTIFSVEEAEGVSFLTMELVEGRRLSELIPAGGMPSAKLLDFAVPLADAVSAAHERGITHRDLKPDNVMVTDDGRLKVLDFGLAKMTDLPAAGGGATQLPTATITGEGKIRGTVSYMSPEQVQGGPLDHRSDIFSLGVVLYEMATGTRPFRGETAADLISSILRDPPRRVGELTGELPRHLERIIHHCLEKDPRKRFQTAMDVCNELEDLRRELAEERVSSGKSAPGSPPVGRLDRKKPGKRAIGLAAGGLLAAAALFLMLLSRGSDPAPKPPALPETGKVRLAVLPFTNMSPDPDQEYFSDGLTEEMIAHLGGLAPDRLGVIARTSAMRYKGSEKAAGEIGLELGVEYLLEGSVRRDAGRLRITAQLIQVSDQTHLWAESYERPMEDVFGIQNEIAGRIARSLEAELLSGQEPAPQEAAPVDPEAFDAYLKGWFFWNKLTRDAVEQSIGHFRRAVELAPDWAPAHQGLAAAYSQQAGDDYIADGEVLPLAKQAALRAIELDERLASGHASLGVIAFLYDWDWEAAERSFERALELDPNATSSHQKYGLFLYAMGRFDEAVAETEAKIELDPLSVVSHLRLGFILGRVGHYERGIAQLEEALELDPTSVGAHRYMGYTLWLMGKREEAVLEFEKAAQFGPGHLNEATLGYFYARIGRREEARRILDRLARPTAEYVPPVPVATLYAALGDRDRAFALLEDAYRQRDDWLVYLRVAVMFDGLRDDPRFQDLVRRMNFPS